MIIYIHKTMCNIEENKMSQIKFNHMPLEKAINTRMSDEEYRAYMELQGIYIIRRDD